MPSTLAFRSLIGLFALLSTGVQAGYESGSYPTLAQATLFSDHDTVVNQPNALSYAIEQGKAIALRFDATFQANSDVLFPKAIFPDAYWRQKAIHRTWVSNMQQLVAHFACAQYRYRHRLAQSTACYEKRRENIHTPYEAMPFVDEPYLSSSLEVNQDHPTQPVSYQMWLPSAAEVPLRSALGSVHQLGTFFGRLADQQSLVLTVRSHIYQLSDHKIRGNTLSAAPMPYFIILPSAQELAQQPNQQAAAAFALQQARILLVGKP